MPGRAGRRRRRPQEDLARFSPPACRRARSQANGLRRPRRPAAARVVRAARDDSRRPCLAAGRCSLSLGHHDRPDRAHPGRERIGAAGRPGGGADRGRGPFPVAPARSGSARVAGPALPDGRPHRPGADPRRSCARGMRLVAGLADVQRRPPPRPGPGRSAGPGLFHRSPRAVAHQPGQGAHLARLDPGALAGRHHRRPGAVAVAPPLAASGPARSWRWPARGRDRC